MGFGPFRNIRINFVDISTLVHLTGCGSRNRQVTEKSTTERSGQIIQFSAISPQRADGSEKQFLPEEMFSILPYFDFNYICIIPNKY